MTAVSVVMSNQIQPPSSNGREFDLELERGVAVLELAAPDVDARRVGLRAVHVDAAVSDSSRRSTTDFRMLQRRQ